MARNVSLLILFDKDKRILLEQCLSGYWVFFGGGIENSETPEQALWRESEEELEYKPQNPRLVMVQDVKEKNAINKKYVYLEKYNNAKLTQHEGQTMNWFHLNDTKSLKMINHDRKVIEYIKDRY